MKDVPAYCGFAAFTGATIAIICIAFSNSALASGVMSALANLATVGGLVFAMVSVSSWKRHQRGQVLLDARRECFASAIKWHRRLAIARSMFSQVTIRDGEDAWKAGQRDRHEKRTEAQTAYLEFRGTTVMLHVLAPCEAKLIGDAIEAVQSKWLLAVFMDKEEGAPSDAHEENRSVIHEIPNRTSDFDKMIETAMQTVETSLGPHLR